MQTTSNNPETTTDRQTALGEILQAELPPADTASLLDDPNLVTITITQAAAIIGVSPSTAHKAYRRTGELIAGVRVIRCGRRCVVSTAALRAALGRSAQI